MSDENKREEILKTAHKELLYALRILHEISEKQSIPEIQQSIALISLAGVSFEEAEKMNKD